VIALNRAEEFELAVKKKFIEEPGQMKLLIVVDKLLTGFDAPPATCLYIDKQMALWSCATSPRSNCGRGQHPLPGSATGFCTSGIASSSRNGFHRSH
jgi:hypothetical protein